MLGAMSIILSDCRIENDGSVIIPSITWTCGDGETWLVTGANGSGKSSLAAALAGELDIVPSPGGLYSNPFGKSSYLVSFEAAAALIEEERKRDDSEFVEGGVDPGRTPRRFIAEVLNATDRAAYPDGRYLESHPAVSLCAVAPVLDRGLKYLSTGEIRRTILCRALASKPELLILDDLYEGLDADSRKRLSGLLAKAAGSSRLLYVLDRYADVPESITHVLEIDRRTITFSGTREAYEDLRRSRAAAGTEVGAGAGGNTSARASLRAELGEAARQGSYTLSDSIRTGEEVLVEMNGVTVQWDGRKVLDGLSWKLRKGEHWLIRGPNGSGKTTFLELITGDNPQVFCNDVSLFGRRRGTGETIWELKEKMGIVSYRLHTEYRQLGDLPLEGVILSGLHDSIGLYQECGEAELDLARRWLALAGFSGRGRELFRDVSYGEQRAILIARAGVKSPPLLILDEPCHGLDEASRRRILDLLEAIAESGSSTLLHVTHDPDEVLPCERHILELRPGETPMYRTLDSQG